MLDSLPVWELGVVIGLSLVPSFVLRFVIEPRYVLAAAPEHRAGRQFRMDLGLFLLAGIMVSVANLVYFGFPVFSSGSKLVLSLATVGFFAAVDLSLVRERKLLLLAIDKGGSLRPPSELYPLTHKFSFIAVSIMLLITVSMLLVFWRDVYWLTMEAPRLGNWDAMKREVLIEVCFVMGVLLLLTIRAIFSYSKNLKLLFRNETEVLEHVSNGDLDKVVPVLTNDEFGFIAGHTNAMIEGLRDRLRMQEGLIVASEVQKNLLPASTPELAKARIFGWLVYSDETGGDFYDFFDDAGPDGAWCGIAVGDVSGHGVGSALLMASARAALRLSMKSGMTLAQCITEVNSQLARDVYGSGRFITLYVLMVHKQTGEIQYCSAGHDPAIVYDPATDTFSELAAPGLPLGVDPEWGYVKRSRPALAPGELLCIGTDGIWETHAPSREMFGKQRLRSILREFVQKNGTTADLAQLEEKVRAELDRFRQGLPLQDDVTMVLLQGVPEGEG